MDRNTKIPVTRVNMWYSDADAAMDLDFAKEFIQNDSNFRVVLYQVDRTKTQVNDVYQESGKDDIVFKTPVELLVSGFKINESESEVYNKTQGSLSFKDKGTMEFGVLISYLTEKKVDIRRGDFIGYAYSETGLKYWEVYDDGRMNMDNKHTLYGTRPYYRSVKCKTADSNQFKGL